MRIISHRANLNGPCEDENNPELIRHAIDLGFDAEIDLRVWRGELYLGHDEPQYKIKYSFLMSNSKKLWIHCKDLESIERVSTTTLNYFWHDRDEYTLTSKGYVWVYPNCPLPALSVCVLPELGYVGNIKKCRAICTDYPVEWKKNV